MHCLLAQRLPQRRQWSLKWRIAHLWKVCSGPWGSRKYLAVGVLSNCCCWMFQQMMILCWNLEISWNSYSETSKISSFWSCCFLFNLNYLPLDNFVSSMCSWKLECKHCSLWPQKTEEERCLRSQQLRAISTGAATASSWFTDRAPLRLLLFQSSSSLLSLRPHLSLHLKRI